MPDLVDRLTALARSERPFDVVALDVCRLLRKDVAHFNWVGVYMIEGSDTLVLKAWDGPKATEHVRIPIGQGICGLAAREAKTVVVDDVNKDPRYLACFLKRDRRSSSRSLRTERWSARSHRQRPAIGVHQRRPRSSRAVRGVGRKAARRRSRLDRKSSVD
jgi:hypothetical protein